MPLPEPSFLAEDRERRMVEARVDQWMLDWIVPVLAYLHDCEEGDQLDADRIRWLLLHGVPRVDK